MEHDHPNNEDFVEEKEIKNLFLKQKPPKRSEPRDTSGAKFNKEIWYEGDDHHEFTYGHHDTLGRNKTKGNPCYTCDNLTDKWVEWLLTTPKTANPFANPGVNVNSAYGDANAFLFGDQECDMDAYFTTVSPFQKPDFRRIVMTKRIPLLVPVYNVISSPQLFPSQRDWEHQKWVEEDVMKDLGGLYNDGIKATFDGEEFYGCCVIRKRPLSIGNIPKDNSIGIPEDTLRENHSTIQVYHGGFWLLISEKQFSPGDHLLSFEAQSRNYEIEAKIMISALV